MQKRVLVVDDDAQIASMVEKMLVSRGMRVSVAPNGREALRLIERDRPHVVFLDIMMPGMDGASVLAELRRRPDMNATRVVMLSARTTARDQTEAKRIGADAYVTKPFSMAQLLDSL